MAAAGRCPWWPRQPGEDGGSGAGWRPDGGRSAGLPRLGRCESVELGSDLQHGDDPRSTHPNVSGSSACGEILLRLVKPDGDGAGSDPVMGGDDGACGDSKGFLCIFLLARGLFANVPGRVSFLVSSGCFRVRCIALLC
jgi:hypothetical protein